MITVVINGQDFQYPEVGDTDWGDSATKSFQSLVATTLQKIGGNFTLENDLTFGGNKGVHCLFFSTIGNDPALSGVYRLSGNELVSWRNEWNTDDWSITVDSSTGDLLIKSHELESYVDPDDGQTKYRPVLDGNGDPIPVTKRVTVSGEIVNADISDSAGILESKLALDYSTDSLHTLINDKALYNLADTDLPDPTATPPDTPPDNQDVLLYDNIDSKWKNSNLLSSHVGNTTNPHLTNIVNLVDTTVVTPTKDDTLLYDDIDSKWKNKPNTVANLKDTTINTPLSGQVLTYDGDDSKWKNQPSASASLTGLTDTDISTTPPPDNGDVLSFDSNDSKWKNSNALTSHLGNKNNPHETSVDNLDDTNITNVSDKDTLLYDSNSSEWVNVENSIDNLSNTDIDSNTLAENDVLVFNGQTLKWENSQIMVNHIGNTSNPHLTTVAKLTDASITTPANKELLQYDYANLKWVNSSDVWTQIEVNDIANINTAITNVTLTSSDKRHQIFTSTTGFDVSLPSSGIKSGEKFVFDFSQAVNYFTTPYVLKVGASDLAYAYNGCFRYICIAITDNPATLSDWKLIYTKTKELILHGEYNNGSFLIENNSRNEASSSTIYTLSAGVWDVSLSFGINGGTISTGAWWFYAINSNGGVIVSYDTEAIGSVIQMAIQNSRPTASLTINGSSISGSAMQGNTVTKLANITTVTANVSLGASIANTGATETVRLIERSTARLVQPRITALS